MRDEFRRQLIESGYLHKLLKPDTSKSVEARLLRKKVTKRKQLWSQQDITDWNCAGQGQIELVEEALKMTISSLMNPTEPMQHYTGYSGFEAALTLNGDDWRDYNRLTFKLRPDCPGHHAPHVNLGLRNDGEEKIPDRYWREGFHMVNLINGVWNDCVWEFPDLPRDYVTNLSFHFNNHGRERFAADEFSVYVSEIWLEQAEEPDVSLGWQGSIGTVSYSTTGYWLNGPKVAIANDINGPFEIISEESGEVAYHGEMMPFENEKGSYGIIDFTTLCREGRYRISTADYVTEPFAVSRHVMDEAAWKVLNFVYSERCGYPVSGGHSSCHADIVAEHKGLKLVYNGGWHDAGDLSQQTLQTGELAQAMLELAQKVKDTDYMLYRRLLEEACWGLDFILKCRFGDGYRAFSAGLTRWTNGLIGDFDDETVRCHNRSFDNWLLCGVQAFAGRVLKDEDGELAWVCVRAAKDDYAFALNRFNEAGFEHRVVMEHTHNASLSQYYAVASWAASQIYAATDDGYYAAEAARFADMMLACQETELPFGGFFYRDASKKHIVHFNHQSREYLFTQALRSLCVTQSGHAEYTKWVNAMRLFGEYQKAMIAYAAPYNMLPSGVHRYDEARDAGTFPFLHGYTDYEAEADNYREQLESGIRLDDAHCVRHFPVWFSFRGNTAVQMAAAKAAAITGNFLHDEALKDIAMDQLYWVSGRNPFRQSLIFGEGSDYAKQYAGLCGETVGEMPVGIQTRLNEDVPYWPMATNATYKEIWLSTAGHWLRLLAEVY
jgi:hypothetical protein